MKMLNRLFLLREELTDDDLEVLHTLVHDKSLTGADYTARLPALDKAIALYGQVPPVTLYRGLPSGRGNAVIAGSVLSFRGYASFSEFFRAASLSAEETRTVVELDTAVRAFPYSKWLESQFRAMDHEEYESSDADHMIEIARNEAEWIFPLASRFKVIGAREEFGFKILSAN